MWDGEFAGALCERRLSAVFEFLMNWNFWVVLATVFPGIVAIYIGLSQNRISNRQALFDRRIQVYFVLQELYDTFKRNAQHLNNFVGYSADILFALLCDSSYLEGVQGAARLYEGEKSLTAAFLNKRHDMFVLAESLSFLFGKIDVTCLSNFVVAYAEVLHTLRGCRICFDSFVCTNEELGSFARVSSDVLKSDLRCLIKQEHFEENIKLMQQTVMGGEWDSVMIKIRKLLKIS